MAPSHRPAPSRAPGRAPRRFPSEGRALRLRRWRVPLLAVLAAPLMLAAPPLAAQETSPETSTRPPMEAPAGVPKAVLEGVPEAVLDPEIGADALSLRLLPLTAEQLADVAEAWRALVRRRTEALVEAELAASRAEGEAREEATARAEARREARDALFERYSLVLDHWARKGGDSARVEAFRTYREAILVGQARELGPLTLAEDGWEWLSDWSGGLGMLLKGALVVAILGAVVVCARLGSRLTGRALSRVPDATRLFRGFLELVAFWGVVVLGLAVVMSTLGVSITPFFALLGGASFVLAFALQDALGNIASGVLIMLNRPFDVGDYVEIGDTAGTVRALNVTATTLDTADNAFVTIPNAEVWGRVITNLTGPERRRVDLRIPVRLDQDIDRAIAVISQVAREHRLVLEEPAPYVETAGIDDGAVTILCFPWVASADYWTVQWELTRLVRQRLAAEGIVVPGPQATLHLGEAARRTLEKVAGPAAPAAGPAAEGAGARQSARGTAGAGKASKGRKGDRPKDEGPDDGEAQDS